MDDPQLGDTRHAVYVEPPPGGKVFLCCLRLEGFSPAGKKARWKALDVRGEPVVTFDAKHPPAATPNEAITRFQRFQVRSSFFEGDARADERVRRILAAEGLRGADTNATAAATRDRASAIRRSLEGRAHGDSAEIIEEDRRR